MKKTFLIIFAVLFCFTLLCSCGSDKTIEKSYAFGDGVYASNVVLHKDGTFVFTFSMISSYIGVGEYSIDGDTLTLYTGDGKYHYTFTITDDGIVFYAARSCDTIWYGEFSDGSLFK